MHFLLIRKNVRDFFRTKGVLRIFDGFFLKNMGIFAAGVRDSRELNVTRLLFAPENYNKEEKFCHHIPEMVCYRSLVEQAFRIL